MPTFDGAYSAVRHAPKSLFVVGQLLIASYLWCDWQKGTYMASLRTILSKLAVATGVTEKRRLFDEAFAHTELSNEERLQLATTHRQWAMSLRSPDGREHEARATFEHVRALVALDRVDDAVDVVAAAQSAMVASSGVGTLEVHYHGAACAVVGVALYRRGDHAEAKPLVLAGDEASAVVGYWWLRSEVLKVLGEVAMYDGDFATAERQALALQEEASAKGDVADTSAALRLLGNLRMHDGRIVEAEDLYRQAIASYVGDPYHESIVRTELNMGIALAHQSKTEMALTALRGALHKAEKAELWAIAAHALNSIADLHFVQGEYIDCIPLHEAALRYAELSGNVVRLVLAHGHLAEAFERAGDSERSLLHLEQSLLTAQGSGHVALIADQEINAAEIYARQGNANRADELFRSAIERMAHSEAHANLATFHAFYARFLLHQERLLDAIVQFDMAIPVLREMNLNPTLFRALYFAGKAHVAAGDAHRGAEYAFEAYDVLERFSLDNIHETKERLLRELQADRMKAELEYQMQAKKQLEDLLDSRTRELCAMATSLSQRNEIIESVLQVLDSSKPSASDLAGDVRMALMSYEPTNEERAAFEHQLFSGKVQFMSALSRLNPALTRRELHIASLLLLDLPSKEIAYLIHSSVTEIDAYRTRLRKKLGLPLRAQLREALQRIEREAHAQASSDSTLGKKLREAFPQLTKKEEEIVLMILQGQSTKTIARILRSSERTVENHRYRLRKKLFPESTESLVSLLLARLGGEANEADSVPLSTND